ncbi:hypothetical protein [Xenorhabdus sp. KK7.4]|uniref:hypothetical protein n=1 Tax=Xenorhabdus sp. KK7.4 TaxID=1851572 RepID=UPI000C0529F0|nr:hypothetical protein [Xenorhabdus sp. KK7.4]PHM51267.1 hypothetical protein Xekk_03840 [Xenorhabdus sp. KK7.4]
MNKFEKHMTQQQIEDYRIEEEAAERRSVRQILYMGLFLMIVSVAAALVRNYDDSYIDNMLRLMQILGVMLSIICFGCVLGVSAYRYLIRIFCKKRI